MPKYQIIKIYPNGQESRSQDAETLPEAQDKLNKMKLSRVEDVITDETSVSFTVAGNRYEIREV